MLKKHIMFFKEDQAFVKKTVAIAVPIALQALFNNVLNLVDTLMIGTLGETEIAAVGLANKVFFVFSLLVFGIVSGSGILTAQYWGKKDIKNIRRVLGMSLCLGVSAAILFLVPSLLCPKIIMRIFTPENNTILVGASYLTIVAISYPINAITQAYVSMLRGVNEVKAPLVITVISILVNAGLNYILIFGKLGIPALGVLGAAIATLIARIIEGLSLLAYVYKKKGPAAGSLKELFYFKADFLKKYFITVIPVIANEFVWGLGVTIYSLAYGRMGNAAVAAITITQSVEQVVLVIFQGVGAATAVILGNEMGAGKLKEAECHAKNLMVLQLILSVLMIGICLIMKTPIISLFHITEEVRQSVEKCFLVFTAYIPVKMFNYILIVGILRSGGDTKASLILDTTGVWLIGVPFAFLGGLLLKAPIYIVYAMVLSEEIYKCILGTKRYKKKKWLNNLAEE